jgi:sugar phosphate isomerase/epimerase
MGDAMKSTTTRRAFLTTVAAGMAVPRLVRAQATRRYPISFSTLGCPAWGWRQILDQADRLGYAAIELRGVGSEMDLTKLAEFSPTRLADARKDLSALGLVISDLGASANMHEKDGPARQKHLDEGRRYIDLAKALDVKYVRMFGDKVPEGEQKADVIARVVEGFRHMATHARAAGVTVLIESHGDFTSSADLERIINGVGSEAFALLWDAHHTFASGKEQPADTYGRLGTWVRHTHLKDSRPGAKDRQYVLVGDGDVPVKAQVQVLAANRYMGYYGFEWEKRWHAEIAEPEVAFPHYAKTVGAYLAAAGVKQS